MSDWIWILLGVGVLWFVCRRGGMGCGMGGHGRRGDSDPTRRELESSTDEPRPNGDGGVEGQAASGDATRRGGGCC